MWPCSLFLCQCSSDKWIKTPKSVKLNFCFILSFCFIWFWLHDLVLYFSLSLPQVNESNAQKLEPWFLFYLGRDCRSVFPAQFVLHPNRPSILHQQRPTSAFKYFSWIWICIQLIDHFSPLSGLFSLHPMLFAVSQSGIITHTILSCHIGGKYYPLKPSEPSVCFGQ